MASAKSSTPTHCAVRVSPRSNAALQELVAAFERGDTRTALEVHTRHLKLFEGLFATSSPILLKAGLKLLGLPGGPLRPPLIDATPPQVEFVRGLLADVGLQPGEGAGG